MVDTLVGGAFAAQLRRVQECIEELEDAGREEDAEAVKLVKDLAERSLAGRRHGGTRELLTTGQAALALGISDQTVRNWVAAGRLAACAHCNRLKDDFTTGRDPLSGHEVRLFDPRRDDWNEHFAWSNDYLRLLPISPIGGATIARLRMNEPVPRRQRQLLRQAMAGGGTPWP
ncbi:MAG TPA: helix-turn-helix domain-containing protein [Chloroflexota bacterium]|nr:helix-turn-helix domain-containing protein [Chloroflexota bacterium]